jgi:hypothetical protein
LLAVSLDTGTANEYSITNIRYRARAGDRAGLFVAAGVELAA